MSIMNHIQDIVRNKFCEFEIAFVILAILKLIYFKLLHPLNIAYTPLTSNMLKLDKSNESNELHTLNIVHISVTFDT